MGFNRRCGFLIGLLYITALSHAQITKHQNEGHHVPSNIKQKGMPMRTQLKISSVESAGLSLFRQEAVAFTERGADKGKIVN